MNIIGPSAIIFSLILPLSGFLFCLLLGKKIPENKVGVVASFFMFLSFLISLLAVYPALTGSIFTEVVFEWFQVDEIVINMGFLIDRLTVIFVTMITGISFLITVFSIGYMSHEKNTYRFFSYLLLFVFFMLLLVMADNLILLFVGWEGVGLASYLLISYYGSKPSALKASNKAFIVNRIGDLGMFGAIFIAYVYFDSFNFSTINNNIDGLILSGAVDLDLVNIFAFFVFWACTAKSAQFPLLVWLPDAMEAPTPVSALIHAATMVTSGIYLISRLFPVFHHAELVNQLIAHIGVFTAFGAAFIALTQVDIKRVLAYSTVSQLGYMFLAVGIQAYEAAIFHMFTHAFFKALLFLSAGSVIFSLHHEQNINKMGGLRSLMPKTSLNFMIGAYTLAGLPLSSAFFSKDEVLWYTVNSQSGSIFLWVVGIITAGMTAFYTYRLYYKVFSGPIISDHEHISDPGKSMTFVLSVLSICSILVGVIGIPTYLSFADSSLIQNYFHGYFSEIHIHSTNTVILDYVLLVVTMLVSLAGFLYARYKYDTYVRNKGKSGILYNLSLRKLYIDEIYGSTFVTLIFVFAKSLVIGVSEILIEWTVRLVTDSLASISKSYKRLHYGVFSNYGIYFLGVVLIFILIFS